MIRKLNDVVHVMVARSERTSASLREKQQEMMNIYIAVQATARDKLHEIHCRLNEASPALFQLQFVLVYFYCSSLRTT